MRCRDLEDLRTRWTSGGSRLLAQARLAELNVERQAILKAFPELSRRNPDGAGTATVPTPNAARPGRRRRKMSAEGRRRIAEAAKRRWAEWRKQNRQS